MSLQSLFQTLVIGLVKNYEFAKRYLVSRQACCVALIIAAQPIAGTLLS